MNVIVSSRVTFTKRELVSNLIHDIRIAYSVFNDTDTSYVRIPYSVFSDTDTSYVKSHILYMHCLDSISLYWRVGILTFREQQLLFAIVKKMFGR